MGVEKHVSGRWEGGSAEVGYVIEGLQKMLWEARVVIRPAPKLGTSCLTVSRRVWKK